MSFEPGDVVLLKSGGPLMTVNKVAKDMGGVEKVWCDWFEKTSLKHGTFSPASLEKYTEDSFSV